VRVPVGTVTTQLVGHEGVKSWTITAPNYRQDVVVNPRPVTPIYVEPLYVDPWVAGPFFSYP